MYIDRYENDLKAYYLVKEILKLEEDNEDTKTGNNKKKALTSKKDQRNNNRRACNCGRCEECKKYHDNLNNEDDSIEDEK